MTDLAKPTGRAPFRGPLADGPTPELLVVDAPRLDHVGRAELTRVVVAGWTLAAAVLGAMARWLRHRLFSRAGSARRVPVTDALSTALIDGFIHLGPTYVKLGQLIASSPGLFPPWLAAASRRCLDQVPPFPTELVRATIAEDLGRPVDDVFASFDDVPLSAASIGQVHACVTDDGREAVVKVQRPDIRRSMTTDLRVMYTVARLAQRTPWGRSANATGMIEDLHALTFRELNPVVEAWNQTRFRDAIWAFGDNEFVTAPEVYWDHCGLRTICMERVHGIPMDDFDTIRERGIDGEMILRRGAKVWTEAVLCHGPFHGDMHAGNIWVLDDGRGCFLDFGIMGELSDVWRGVVRDLYYTCVFDRDFTRVARAYRRVGVFPPDMGTDEEIGERLGLVLGSLLDGGLGSISLGEMITSSVELMKDYGGTPPQELMLVGKQLLYIERYTRVLAPDYAVIQDPYLISNVFPDAAGGSSGS